MHLPPDIYLLVLPQVHLLDLAGPAQVLYNPSILGPTRLHYVSPVAGVVSAQGLSLSALEPLPHSIKENSWVLVIGSYQSKQVYQTEVGKKAATWLQQQEWGDLTLGCICSGALLAAKAGLLTDKSCTTHHHLIEQLKEAAPTSKVLENRLFVGDGNIWTSAGISTGIDLCLHLVSRFWDHQTANQIARNLVLYHRRNGDDPQLSIWLQHRNHVNQRIHKIQDLLTSNPSRNWTRQELAEQSYLSPRHLNRLFSKQTGTTLGDYQQQLKVALARELITQSDLPLGEISDRAGFGSDRQFRRVWKKWG